MAFCSSRGHHVQLTHAELASHIARCQASLLVQAVMMSHKLKHGFGSMQQVQLDPSL